MKAKQVRRIRKHHNNTLQTNPRHREKETKISNSNKIQRWQLKYNNQLSISYQIDCIVRRTQNTKIIKQGPNTEPSMNNVDSNKQWSNNNITNHFKTDNSLRICGLIYILLVPNPRWRFCWLCKKGFNSHRGFPSIAMYIHHRHLIQSN